MKHGPYVTKLITLFIAREAIPTGGSIEHAIQFFTDMEHRKAVLQRASAMALKGIASIKNAHDNPYGKDDEAIAKAILTEIDKHRRIL